MPNFEQIKENFYRYISDTTKNLPKKFTISKDDITIYHPAKHPKIKKRTYEEDGCMYIYSFWDKAADDENPLKIGKAGPDSHARYQNHHYNSHSSKSCLANSLLQEKNILKKWGVDIEKAEKQHEERSSEIIKTAILANCYRVDIKIKYDSKNINGYDIFALELIEGLLHYIYKPKFEGWNNQRKGETYDSN